MALAADYDVSDDSERLQPQSIHAYLTDSYWCPGIALSLVERAIAGSLCVGVYFGSEQVAFARAISDRATFAHLANVYVVPDHQGRGIASAMIDHLHKHPQLQNLRRWTLNTRDAHSLYERYGWERISGIFMQRYAAAASPRVSA